MKEKNTPKEQVEKNNLYVRTEQVLKIYQKNKEHKKEEKEHTKK